MKNTLVFDFDGTLFHLFVGFDLSPYSRRMSQGMEKLGGVFDASRNPYEIFPLLQPGSDFLPEDKLPEARLVADKIISDAEKTAYCCGRPVEGAIEALKKMKASGYRIAICTNNTATVPQRFLSDFLPGLFCPTIGRNPAHPEWMKPDPHLLRQALSDLESSVKESWFVGDATRDYFCAQACGCDFLGIGVTPSKHARLTGVVPDADLFSDYGSLLKRVTETKLI